MRTRAVIWLAPVALVLAAHTAAAATALIEADPGVQSGIFSLRIAPLSVFYPSRQP